MARLSGLMLPLHREDNSDGYLLGGYVETLSLEDLTEIFARAMLDRSRSNYDSAEAYRRKRDMAVRLQDGNAYVNSNENLKNIGVWTKSLSVKEARRHLDNVNICLYSSCHVSFRIIEI